MSYKFAAGYNNTGSLATINPQPRTPAILPGRITEALDGTEFIDGYSTTELVYSALDSTQLNALLTQFGLSYTTRYVLCTLTLKVNKDRAEANYNGILHYPEELDFTNFWPDVTFKVKRLVAL